MSNKKVLVIGLYCASPQLVFDQFIDSMPNLKGLMHRGVWGTLESTVPPITVPAWTSMMTGKDPGTLGFYGFRNRKNHSYDEMMFATSLAVKEETVWQTLSKKERKVIIIGVPQTYPPKPVNGHMITCFLTPGTDSDFTYPKELKDEIQKEFGNYILDVDDFRTDDKDALIERIHALSRQRFAVAMYLMERKEWDFMMFVDMGPDRLHHGLWRFYVRDHPDYEPGNPYEDKFREYYSMLDDQIGLVLEKVDEDTIVFVVSDHGAKGMVGGICINEWLMQEGYLKGKDYPSDVKQLKHENIDWENTKAWGSGGYYGRLFINVKDREPNGVVPQEDYEAVRDEIVSKLGSMKDEKGRDLGTKVYKPQEVYDEVKGIPPDLIVYFGNLDWRSVGSIGYGSVYTYENDTGPDDANHQTEGIYIITMPHKSNGTRIDGRRIFDIAPTILSLFDIEPLPGTKGRVIKEVL